jgi:hypothetical protein
MLERFAPSLSTVKDPVTDGQALTKAIGQWISDVLFAASPDHSSPEDLIRELTGSRRHMFQSAGFYDSLPWKVKW